jgi:hypothetical protein
MVLLYLISVVILLMIFEDRQLRLVMMRFCAPLVHRQNTRFSMLQSLVWYFIRQESVMKRSFLFGNIFWFKTWERSFWGSGRRDFSGSESLRSASVIRENYSFRPH